MAEDRKKTRQKAARRVTTPTYQWRCKDRAGARTLSVASWKISSSIRMRKSQGKRLCPSEMPLWITSSATPWFSSEHADSAHALPERFLARRTRDAQTASFVSEVGCIFGRCCNLHRARFRRTFQTEVNASFQGHAISLHSH